MKYNICRYVETEASLCEESQSVWRRSSVPLLLNSDDDHRYIYDGIELVNPKQVQELTMIKMLSNN